MKKFTEKYIMKNIYKFITFFVIRYYSFRRKIIFRKNTSDVGAFRQVFVQREYKLPIEINPKFIIDGRANVGYSSLWFANKFPNAKIIAIEPEDSNYETLKQNINKYKNIKSIKSGLWSKNAYLKIVDTGWGNWGFRTDEVRAKEKYDIKAITINQILKDSGFDKIDVLKLDIEGAEKEVFSENTQWLSKTNMIIIELHDYFKKGCSDAFYSVINKNDWTEYTRGENIIMIRKNWL